MAFNSCDPCTCIPASIDQELYHNMSLTVLCGILTAIQSGGGIADTVNVAAWGGAPTTLGQKAMAASVPVVIASDQTSFPVTVAAGSAIIGNVRIDQTTPGTTNGVVVNSGTLTTVTTVTGVTAITGSVTPGTAAANLGKAEDTAHASGDVGIFALAVRNDAYALPTTTDNDYIQLSATNEGALHISIDTRSNSGTASNILKVEDLASANGDAGVMVLMKQQLNPANDVGSDGDYQTFRGNPEGYLYTDTVRRNTMTHTQPTITTATSFTLAASNGNRRYLFIQNNSAANIMINLNNGTLTGITPTSTNLGLVLAPGASYETPPNYCPTAAVTAYQTSGGDINTVSVVVGL